MKEVITDAIPYVVNSLIADTNGALNLWMIDGLENMAIDIQMEEPIKITNKYVGVAVDGTLFDMSKGEERPSVVPPLMPLHIDNAPAKLQCFISNYFVDSLFNAVREVYPLEFMIESTDLPHDFPI